jgi:hypothetical protein
MLKDITSNRIAQRIYWLIRDEVSSGVPAITDL